MTTTYAETLKKNGADYEDRLSMAVNRWLGEDRRSIVAIVESGELSDAEVETACDVADLYDVAATDVVTAIGETCRMMLADEAVRS
jgi:hypothetical protein